MDFTYDEYVDLINLLKEKNYQFTNYKDYKNIERSVIFRHDIDNSLKRALEIAKIENENGIKSTFFVLLSTNFYNIFSKESNSILREIISFGHEVGLHFDEKRYEINDGEDLVYYVEYEKDILAGALDIVVETVSMHRPSKWILENDIKFKNIINSYSKTFLHEFKYLSDSRMHWREDVIGIVRSEEFDKLHILTHPFWYAEDKGNIKERASEFIKDANKERYYQMKDNIRDIEDIIEEDELYDNRAKTNFGLS